MRIIVTGYRHWQDSRVIWNRMQRLQDVCALERSGLEVAVGDCPTGVDSFIRDWAVTAPASLRIFYADWGTHGQSAGPLRNKEMIDTVMREGPVDRVIAFLHPDPKGTRQCAFYAQAMGLHVEKIWEMPR
jgi:hypothetical protein